MVKKNDAAQMALSFDVPADATQELVSFENLAPTKLKPKGMSLANFISYEEAICCFGKQEPYEITDVAWCDKAEEVGGKKNVWLNAQNESVEIVLPPKLPDGYRMAAHDSWVIIEALIYCPDFVYDLEYLEIALQDLDSFDTIGINLEKTRLQITKAIKKNS